MVGAVDRSESAPKHTHSLTDSLTVGATKEVTTRCQNTVACSDREMGEYTMAVSGQRLGKHVPAATDTHAITEEWCFLCGPCRDFISKGQG
jgi:hypothetical protein